MKLIIKKYLDKMGLLSSIRDIKNKKIKDYKYNEKLYIKNLKNTFGDQKGQVEFLINNILNYEKNGLYREGFFVDLAAADGITGSNTYFLEKYLGWRGLLIEGNPNFIPELKRNRTSKILNKCCGENIGEEVKFRIDNGQLSGIVSENTDNNLRLRSSQLKKAQVITIKTTTLENELIEISAPEIIDFLSLDVEGAEYLVLKNFNFKRYKFKCIAVERPSIELDLLLDLNGYKQIKHLFYDVIYVHKEYYETINLEPKIRFAVTPKKTW